MERNPIRLIGVVSRLARQLRTVADAAERKTEEKLYRRLSRLGATGETVTKALNEFVMEGKPIHKSDLLRCVRELRKYRRFDHALEIMEWMEKRKMNFSYADYAIRLDLVAKIKGVDAAENFMSSLPPPAQNQLTHGALLNCYCNELLYDKALALFRKMDQLNFVSCCLPFNNLMSLHMRSGQPEKVPCLVQEMKQKNISPCSFTYNIWMQSYGCVNDFEGVERVLEEMIREDEEKCNWTTYSNLATIYVKAGHFEKAEAALKKMEKLIGPQDREAYHFLISLYANTSNLDEVNRVWTSLKSSFNITTNASYLVILQALAKLKDVEGVTKCFKEWESIRISYDMRIANVAVRVYLGQDMYEEAASIFDDAFERCNGPYFKAREMFMVFFLRTHQLDLALNHMKEAFSEAEALEWQPRQETVSAFFGYFEQEKDVGGAEKFCSILKHINRLDSNAYVLLLKTYAAAGRLAPEIRKRLEEDGIETSEELRNLLDKVCPL